MFSMSIAVTEKSVRLSLRRMGRGWETRMQRRRTTKTQACPLSLFRPQMEYDEPGASEVLRRGGRKERGRQESCRASRAILSFIYIQGFHKHVNDINTETEADTE